MERGPDDFLRPFETYGSKGACIHTRSLGRLYNMKGAKGCLFICLAIAGRTSIKCLAGASNSRRVEVQRNSDQ